MFKLFIILVALAVILILAINFLPPTGISIIDRFRLRLVDEWHKAYKWISVQMMAAAGLCEAAAIAIREGWAQFPPEMAAVLPPSLLGRISLGLLVVGIIGRMFKKKTA